VSRALLPPLPRRNCSATDGARNTEAAGTGIIPAFIEVDDLTFGNLHCSCSSLAIWIIEKGKDSSKVICKSVTFSRLLVSVFSSSCSSFGMFYIAEPNC